MAKGHNEPTRENDYIEQLEWRSRYGSRRSVHYEPKWKYKIVYRYPPTTLFDKTMGMLLLLGVTSGVLFLISSDMLTSGAKIFFVSIIALIVTIILFAVRDATKDSDDDSKPID